MTEFPYGRLFWLLDPDADEGAVERGEGRLVFVARTDGECVWVTVVSTLETLQADTSQLLALRNDA